jgi:hypothetical protein
MAQLFIERKPSARSGRIDYGYAVESARNIAADRVILTGEAPQLAGLESDLARLNASIRDFPSTRPMRLRHFRLNLRRVLPPPKRYRNRLPRLQV